MRGLSEALGGPPTLAPALVVTVLKRRIIYVAAKAHMRQSATQRASHRCVAKKLRERMPGDVQKLDLFMSPLRRHIFVCFMAKSAFLRGFSALAPYSGVGPI